MIIRKYFKTKENKFVDIPVMYFMGANNSNWKNNKLVYIGKRDMQYFCEKDNNGRKQLNFIEATIEHPLKTMSKHVQTKFWKFAMFFDPITKYVIYIPCRYLDSRFDKDHIYDFCIMSTKYYEWSGDMYCLWLNDFKTEADGSYLLPIMVIDDYDNRIDDKYHKMMKDNKKQIEYEEKLSQKSQDEINRKEYKEKIEPKLKKFFKENNITFDIDWCTEHADLLYKGTFIDGLEILSYYDD